VPEGPIYQSGAIVGGQIGETAKEMKRYADGIAIKNGNV
jgi:hypothetical protein